MQATVHRKWIVAEEGLEEGHAAQAAHEGDAGNYTTLSREMKQLGTPWLNILKVCYGPCCLLQSHHRSGQ